jgi:hypothetical protein
VSGTPLDAWGVWLKGSLWAYPALEAVHIAGIALLIGSLVVLELRVLGLGRELAVDALAQLAMPVSLIGFAVAALSGTLLFAADAFDLLVNPAFRLKMLALLLLGTNATLFHAFGGLRSGGVGAKLQIALSLLLWLAVIACGRMIAYV